MNDNKKDLLSLSREELLELVTSLSEPRYRAEQLFVGMHKGISPEDMTNLGKAFKEKLFGAAYFYLPTIEKKLVSAIDGTVKYLFALNDGNCIESVVMKYKHGNTICISSEVGCPMGCAFCASTLGGIVRKLLPSEMLSQVIATEKDSGERISNIVMMGIGEPLDNYDNALKFLRLVGSPDGLNIGYRHISLSTCGIVDKIYTLAEENLPITLSISLHASSDEKRSELMPVNKRWNIEALLRACSDYFGKTGRRISFEYTLVRGKNDSDEDARRLASVLRKYCRDMPLHVNLIPVNNVTERGFLPTEKGFVERFRDTLLSLHVNATVRRKLGSDIDASCGQLRAKKNN